MPLLETLDTFFTHAAPTGRGDALLAAFSGGPDSTALLLGLADLAPRRGFRVIAAHLDHATDPGSADRAAAAAREASRLGVECRVARRDVAAIAREGGWSASPEEAGRRVRYGFLEAIRREAGARWIATAHHRDDQAETLALRLLQGSGVEGLAGIRVRRGRVVRPLLELSREELRRAVEAAGAVPVDDPTNQDRAFARNRVRHDLLPALEAVEAGTGDSLARLAAAAQGAREALDRQLSALLRPESTAEGGVAVRRESFEALPAPLVPHALALLHRCAGAAHPPGRASREELLRQLAGGTAGAGCDLPGGWRWEAGERYLALRRRGVPAPPFSYTFAVPGTVELPELGLAVRIRRQPAEPWMFRGSRHRAGLALPVVPGERVVVRSRRPGDRLQPLGAPGTRKLKEVLIDRRVPRPERDRLPLLCVGGRIAWVPGVTVDEAFRLPRELLAERDRDDGDRACWAAEVIS